MATARWRRAGGVRGSWRIALLGVVTCLLAACGAVPGRHLSSVVTVSQSEGIAFANAHQGWLVTTQGLFRTVDGGKAWTVETSAPPLRSVVAVSDARLWGLTATGFYLSNDGGRTWHESTEGSFINPDPVGTTSGYMVQQGAQGDRLLQTNDGGQKWSVVAGAWSVAPSSQSDNTARVCMDASGNGWALLRAVNGQSDTILGTADGGHIWTTKVRIALPQDASGSVGMVSCAKRSTSAWILVTGGTSLSEESYTVYLATGGAHGTVRPVLAVGTAAGGLPPGNPPSGISRSGPANPIALQSTGDTSAIVLGACGSCGTYGSMRVSVTQDAGAHWQVNVVQGAVPGCRVAACVTRGGGQVWLLAGKSASRETSGSTPILPMLFWSVHGNRWHAMLSSNGKS